MRAHIVLLSRLNDARLPESEPDPRGWEVYGSDGVKVGEVDDLLVDANSHVVRYLDVDLDRATLGAGRRTVSEAGEEEGEVLAQEVAAGLGVGLTAPRGTPSGGPAPATGTSGLGPIAEHLVRETLSDTENEMTGGASRRPRSRHVLVPVELARIEGGRRISLVDLRSGDMEILPEYGGAEIDEDGDHALRLRYGLEQEARIR